MKVELPNANDLNNYKRYEVSKDDKIISFINHDLKNKIIGLNDIGCREMSLVFPSWFDEDFKINYNIFKKIMNRLGYSIEIVDCHDKQRIFISW